MEESVDGETIVYPARTAAMRHACRGRRRMLMATALYASRHLRTHCRLQMTIRVLPRGAGAANTPSAAPATPPSSAVRMTAARFADNPASYSCSPRPADADVTPRGGRPRAALTSTRGRASPAAPPGSSETRGRPLPPLPCEPSLPALRPLDARSAEPPAVGCPTPGLRAIK